MKSYLDDVLGSVLLTLTLLFVGLAPFADLHAAQKPAADGPVRQATLACAGPSHNLVRTHLRLI